MLQWFRQFVKFNVKKNTNRKKYILTKIVFVIEKEQDRKTRREVCLLFEDWTRRREKLRKEGSFDLLEKWCYTRNTIRFSSCLQGMNFLKRNKNWKPSPSAFTLGFHPPPLALRSVVTGGSASSLHHLAYNGPHICDAEVLVWIELGFSDCYHSPISFIPHFLYRAFMLNATVFIYSEILEDLFLFKFFYNWIWGLHFPFLESGLDTFTNFKRRPDVLTECPYRTQKLLSLQ